MMSVYPDIYTASPDTDSYISAKVNPPSNSHTTTILHYQDFFITQLMLLIHEYCIDLYVCLSLSILSECFMLSLYSLMITTPFEITFTPLNLTQLYQHQYTVWRAFGIGSLMGTRLRNPYDE